MTSMLYLKDAFVCLKARLFSLITPIWRIILEPAWTTCICLYSDIFPRLTFAAHCSKDVCAAIVLFFRINALSSIEIIFIRRKLFMEYICQGIIFLILSIDHPTLHISWTFLFEALVLGLIPPYFQVFCLFLLIVLLCIWALSGSFRWLGAIFVSSASGYTCSRNQITFALSRPTALVKF